MKALTSAFGTVQQDQDLYLIFGSEGQRLDHFVTNLVAAYKVNMLEAIGICTHGMNMH